MEIDSFLSYLKNIKRYSALTITAYKEDLNQFREFCEKVELIRQDEEITSKMVRRFEMGLMSGGLKIGGVDGEEKLRPMTARSVRRKLSSLRTYFRYLVREGKLTEDPTEIVVAPKMGKRLPVFVPDYQMDEVLDKHASDKDFANIRDRDGVDDGLLYRNETLGTGGIEIGRRRFGGSGDPGEWERRQTTDCSHVTGIGRRSPDLSEQAGRTGR